MRALLVLSAIALASAGDVVQLTPENFNAEVGDESLTLTLVKFYAPWCGHCKAMAADYETAATKLKEIDPKIKLAELDADHYRDFASKFDVQGFPTLKIFRGGDTSNPEDYNGARSIDGLIAAVRKAARPAITLVESAEELESKAQAAVEAGELVIKAVLPADNAKEFETFQKFAKKAVKSFTIFAYRGSERAIEVLTGDAPVPYTEKKLTAAKLTQWSDANRFPLYGEINQDNYKAYMDRGVPLGWVFIDPESDTTQELKSVILEVAKATKGRISWVHLSGVMYGGMAQRVGLEGKKWPAIGVDDIKEKKHYAFSPEGEVPTAEALTKWAQSLLNGQLEATIRSEPEPDMQPGEDGVFVLTGKNFKQSTVDSGLDVLVEFYAPWCGHCKALAPEYSAAAKALEGNQHLRLAKMDATANDIPLQGFEVEGYPTLYWVKAGKDGHPAQVTKYDGGRTKDDIINFVKEHSSSKVTVDE